MEAKASDVPKATIENAIKNFKNSEAIEQMSEVGVYTFVGFKAVWGGFKGRKEIGKERKKKEKSTEQYTPLVIGEAARRGGAAS